MLENKPSYTQSQNLPVSYVYRTAHKSDNINLSLEILIPPSKQSPLLPLPSNRPNLLSFLPVDAVLYSALIGPLSCDQR